MSVPKKWASLPVAQRGGKGTGHLRLGVWVGLRGSGSLDRGQIWAGRGAFTREHFLGVLLCTVLPQDTLFPRAASGLAGQV